MQMVEELSYIQLLSDEEVIAAFMSDTVAFMQSLPNQITPVIDHQFFPGLYVRTMSVPSGAQLLSKVHKTTHAIEVVKGRILIFDGISDPVILKAPYIGESKAGSQRVGICLEDVVWRNFHVTKIKPTDDSDAARLLAVQKIERKVVEPFNNLNLNKEVRTLCLG